MRQLIKIFTIFVIVFLAASTYSWAESQSSVSYRRVVSQLQSLRDSGVDRLSPEYKRQAGKLMLQSMELYYRRDGDTRTTVGRATSTGGYEFKPVAVNRASSDATTYRASSDKKTQRGEKVSTTKKKNHYLHGNFAPDLQEPAIHQYCRCFIQRLASR